MHPNQWRRLALVGVLALAAAPAEAQEPAQAGPPAGVYELVPGESDDIGPRVDRAVAHMNFVIRGIARGRLKGANEPIQRLEISYPGDTVRVLLRASEPPIDTPRDGSFTDYRRPDGEVVKVRTELSPDVIDQLFDSADGEKRMVYRMRQDGRLALEVEVLSEKLREPFTYTWVFRPLPEGSVR